MITVALTSIPPRFATLPARLSALLTQGPARVCLTLPRSYRRFPDWDGRVPPLPPGIEILRAEDSGPASKFLTAFSRYPDSDILIADDDCGYAPGWLDAFASARATFPGAAIAASRFDSARLGLPAGHDIVQGFAGVLLRPRWLDPGALTPDAPAIWVDDLWLSAHLAAADVPIVECPAASAHVRALAAPAALQDARVAGLTRADLNRQVAADLQTRLGIWR